MLLLKREMFQQQHRHSSDCCRKYQRAWYIGQPVGQTLLSARRTCREKVKTIFGVTTKRRRAAVVQLVDKLALAGHYSIALAAAPTVVTVFSTAVIVHHRARNTPLVAHNIHVVLDTACNRSTG